MRLISRLRDRCYCAFCKAERKIYVKKHIDLTNVLGSVFLALAITLASWGQPDARGLMLFCIFAVSGEIFVYLRWRGAIKCSLCGFDPLVYKRSPTAAAKLVREFFEARAENPQFQLTRSPLLEVQRQRRARERKLMEYKAHEAKMARKQNSSSPQLTRPKSL